MDKSVGYMYFQFKHNCLLIEGDSKTSVRLGINNGPSEKTCTYQGIV